MPHQSADSVLGVAWARFCAPRTPLQGKSGGILRHIEGAWPAGTGTFHGGSKGSRVLPLFWRDTHIAFQSVCGTPAFSSRAIHATVIVVFLLISPARRTFAGSPFLRSRNVSIPIPHFSSATLAQFFYVAAQSGIFAYFINYMTSQAPGTISDKAASSLASVGFIVSMACFAAVAAYGFSWQWLSGFGGSVAPSLHSH